MPRGKNYVNNNKGMTVQTSAKKKAPSMEQCFYGKGCTRANCIYRHDGEATAGGAGGEKSAEPCMPFLAGLCTFTAAGCRKRHPNKAEAERLIAKYQQTKCRYGKHCKTTGCLYIHPGDAENGAAATAAFPPLAGGAAAPRPATAPTGAWKPMAPTGAALVAGVATIPRGPAPAAAAPQQQAPPAQAPIKPAWGQAAPPAQPASASPAPAAPSQPIKTPAPAVSAWGKPGLNPILASHAATASSKATAVKQDGATNGAAAANTDNKTSNGMAKLGTVASKSKTRTAPKAPAAHTTAPAAAAPAPPPAPVVTPKLATPALSFAAAAAVAPPAQHQQQPPPAPKPSSSSLTAPQESSSLNIHAKEFVPGGGF